MTSNCSSTTTGTPQGREESQRLHQRQEQQERQGEFPIPVSSYSLLDLMNQDPDSLYYLLSQAPATTTTAAAALMGDDTTATTPPALPLLPSCTSNIRTASEGGLQQQQQQQQGGHAVHDLAESRRRVLLTILDEAMELLSADDGDEDFGFYDYDNADGYSRRYWVQQDTTGSDKRRSDWDGDVPPSQ